MLALHLTVIYMYTKFQNITFARLREKLDGKSVCILYLTEMFIFTCTWPLNGGQVSLGFA